MIGLTMTKPLRPKIMPAFALGSEARYKRRFVRAMQAWPSADALAADMAEAGINRNISTWIRYRNGNRTPPPWLCELLLTRSIEQTKQQISALEMRLEAICVRVV